MDKELYFFNIPQGPVIHPLSVTTMHEAAMDEFGLTMVSKPLCIFTAVNDTYSFLMITFLVVSTLITNWCKDCDYIIYSKFPGMF